MVPLSSLWLPILASAGGVFVASSIVHMVLSYHRSNYGRLVDEDAVLEALRRAGVAPGNYMFPHMSSPKEMGSPGMLEKYNKGPVGVMNVIQNGPPAMPKVLAQWFAYSVVVSIFAGYLTGRMRHTSRSSGWPEPSPSSRMHPPTPPTRSGRANAGAPRSSTRSTLSCTRC